MTRDVTSENITEGVQGVGGIDVQDCNILRLRSGNEAECLIVIKINTVTPGVPGLRWIRTRTSNLSSGKFLSQERAHSTTEKKDRVPKIES